MVDADAVSSVSMLWCSICRRSNYGDGGMRITLHIRGKFNFRKIRIATIAVRMAQRPCPTSIACACVSFCSSIGWGWWWWWWWWWWCAMCLTYCWTQTFPTIEDCVVHERNVSRLCVFSTLRWALGKITMILVWGFGLSGHVETRRSWS